MGWVKGTVGLWTGEPVYFPPRDTSKLTSGHSAFAQDIALKYVLSREG